MKSYTFIQHRTHRKEKNFWQHLIKLSERDERFPAFPHCFYEISMMGNEAGVRMQSPEDWHRLSLHVSSKHSLFSLCASDLALGSKKNGTCLALMKFTFSGKWRIKKNVKIVNSEPCYGGVSRCGWGGTALRYHTLWGVQNEQWMNDRTKKNSRRSHWEIWVHVWFLRL